MFSIFLYSVHLSLVFPTATIYIDDCVPQSPLKPRPAIIGWLEFQMKEVIMID